MFGTSGVTAGKLTWVSPVDWSDAHRKLRKGFAGAAAPFATVAKNTRKKTGAGTRMSARQVTRKRKETASQSSTWNTRRHILLTRVASQPSENGLGILR